MRYLNQRYTMPYKECKGILTDVGTEALLWVRMGALFSAPACTAQKSICGTIRLG